MASGTTGDRRWAPARRGGMTVLGKVAVPKPINLPSQRLENHGLDPNVEIVPKGTLSWGSRSSASTPNAWGSSLHSPSADSSSNSPSHLSGRPSSGESGTRPSTAGSDRALDSTNAWGSNSRPSSASGALSSSQTSLASLRPRSAETRPGSSQLSRFAESVLDNPLAAGMERLGPRSFKKDGFSLSSGDFPVLGSEKNGCGENAGPQEHASQGSELSSEPVLLLKEGNRSVNADPKNRVENSWGRDNAPCGEDGGPDADKWHGDHPPHQNAGILPQQFSAWHGPLVNNPPGGVWFRGPPGGPPYGAPVAPGGFPGEPFPYYRPQIPPPALPNLQSIPPGAGPRGHHSTGGDMYRPQMPDGFIRPGMPLRPGYYPGPMPYDGYFGPPMSYHNSNERDIAYTGVTAGHPRYPVQNAPEIPHRSGGYSSTNKASDGEEVDLGHVHDTRGQYKVLLKQQDSWDGKGEGHKREGSVTKDESFLDKGETGKKVSWKNHWRSDRSNEEKDLENVEPVEEGSQKFGFRGAGPSLTRVKALENVPRADDADSAKGPYKNSVVPEAPKSTVAAPKDLIQKIEGLNAKARGSDDRHEYPVVYNRSDEENNFQGPATMSSHSAKEIGSDALHVERIHAGRVIKTSISERDAPTGGKSLEQADVSGATITRHYPHGVQGKSHHRGKGRSSTQDVDELWKRSREPDQSVVLPDASLEISDIHVPHHMSGNANDICAPLCQGKDEGGTLSIAYDPSESGAERAKMQELAKQRVKQRQVEEEERDRDQKAKARMKLEELNRRAQTKDGSIGKGENVSINSTLNKQHHLQPVVGTTKASAGTVMLGTQIVSGTIAVFEGNEGIERSTVPSNLSQEPPDGACEEHALVGSPSGPLKQDMKTGGASDPIEDGRTSKQRRMGSKHKSHISSEKNFNEKCILEPSKVLADGADGVTKSVDFPHDSTPSCEDSIPVNPHGLVESMVQQRRKGNKTSRNKHKVDESSFLPASHVLASKEIVVPNTLEERSKLKSPESNLDSTQVESTPDLGDAKQLSERHPAVAGEEVHARGNYQWKSQHSRRIPRNQQANRFADKLHSSESVVWAPVRSQNRTEVSDEASDRALVVGVNPTVKIDNPVQNNPKNKRAEIERYVPKPAAKEMAQQGSGHQHTVPSSSINSGDVSVEGKGGSGLQNIENVQPAKPSSRNGDGRLNKPGRAHGSWRQRGPKESTLHDSADGQSYTSDVGKEVQKLSGHHQAEEHELGPVDEKPKRSDELASGDGSNLPSNTNSAAEVPNHPARDQGVTGRGKRAFRVHRATGVTVDRDQKESIEEMDENGNQSLAPEVIQRGPVVPKENHVVSERSTSHWQPKSHSSSAHISRGGRVTGGQNIQADSGGIDAELPHGGLPALAQHGMEHRESLSTNDNRKYNSRKDFVNEAGNVEDKIEKKASAIGVHIHSSTQGPVRSTGDVRHESHFPSGFHKNQGGRSARGNGSYGDWNSSGQENNRHHERQRPNSHLRYQPVGTYSDSRSNHVEGSKDGSQSTGMKFKEKSGQSSSRRGGANLADQNIGTSRVDPDCN